MSRADILEKIVRTKHEEVAVLRRRTDEARLREQIALQPAPRGFLRALNENIELTRRMALIAEIKKASPSKGVIRPDFDPAAIARQYHRGGAACLSVLTDTTYFQGRLEYLGKAHAMVPLPLLRKDFIIDPLQILEARAATADAILLIAACLAPAHLHELHGIAKSLGMDVLVEIHNQQELDALVAAGPLPPIMGINNRNLHDFTVDLGTTKRLAPQLVKAGAFVVAESGIYTPKDVAELKAAGASAILVGESLMREKDVEAATKRLLGTSEAS